MRHAEAVDLIRGGVAAAEVWAELGAGRGTFTRALGELVGPEGTVWAVDRSTDAVRALEDLSLPGGAALNVRQADFRLPLELPALDGVLLANSLHFVEDQARVLRRIAGYLRPEGRILLVEYDRARGNRWVPHPIPLERFRILAEEVGLSPPREIGRRRSTHWREMYAAASSCL